MTRNKSWFRGIAVVITILAMGLAAVLLFTGFRYWKSTELVHASSLTVDFIMAQSLFFGKNGIPGRDFDVTSSGAIIVHSSDGIYAIDPEEPAAPLLQFNEAPAQVSSIAVDANDAILSIANRFFGIVDGAGELMAAFPLPSANVRLARSVREDCVYLFGGQEDSYRLYLFHADGTFEILVEIEEPIEAVTDTWDRVFLAAKDRIFSVTPGGPTLLLEMSAADLDGGILSLAASLDGNTLFFATNSHVYAMRGQGAISIVDDSGGSLQLRGDRLYVWDRTRKLLYSLSGAGRIFD